MPTHRLLAGALHVDDCVAFSRTLCKLCIAKAITIAWPSDVGASVEEESPFIQFLHVDIEVLPRRNISTGWLAVSPSFRNEKYVEGASLHPKVARLPVFLNNQYQCKTSLSSYLWGTFCTYDRVFQGSSSRSVPALANLLCEQFLLLWPQSWLGDVCCSFPRRHRSVFCGIIRKTGCLIKHSEVLHTLSHTSFESWDCSLVLHCFRKLCQEACDIIQRSITM